MENETFTIKTGEWSGPFEVLLDLIEKRKFFINDLSLSQVTEDFIAFISSKTGEKIVERTSFIVIASTLILIKARSLLPTFSLSESEESDVTELEKRLSLYEKLVSCSKKVSALWLKNPLRFRATPKKTKIITAGFYPPKNKDTEFFRILAVSSLNKTKSEVLKKESKEVVVAKVIRMEEVIDSLRTRIEKAVSTSFRDLVKNGTFGEAKTNVIVNFLALLELVRVGLFSVGQDELFGDIMIDKVVE